MSHKAQMKLLEQERQKEIKEQEVLRKENARLNSLVKILDHHKSQIKKIHETHS